jgi:hypothetical protein
MHGGLHLTASELPPVDVTADEAAKANAAKLLTEGEKSLFAKLLCRERQLLAARRTAEYWKAEHLAGNDRIAWIQAQRDAHYQQVQQLKHELAEYRDEEAHFAQFEDDPTDLRGPGDD